MDQRLRELVGQRVRRLRLQAGRSLREQARRTGLSASALSQLENNRGGISLERLQRFAEDFGLHVTDLLGPPALPSGSGDEPDAEVIRKCLSEVPGIRRGQGVLYQLIGVSVGHTLQPYLLSFEPGGGFEDDRMGHVGEEFAYALQGEVEVLLGTEVHRLSQGDCIRFRTERPHAFRNASAEGIALVVGAATPPW